MDEIVKLIFNHITDQKIQDTGRKFTEKEVADIISIVAVMVGDPMPSANKKLYMMLMNHINLPEHLNDHLMTAVMSSRLALKQCLEMHNNESNALDNLLSSFKDNISIDD